MNHPKKKIAIIGVGNMGKSIVSRLLDAGFVSPENLTLSSRTRDSLADFERLGVTVVSDNKEAAKQSGIIILGVKPSVMAEALDGMKEALTDGHLIISVAAGVTIGSIQKVIGLRKVARVMPNLAVSVGESMSVWCKSKEVNETDTGIVGDLLSSLGKHFEVMDEELFDVATGISGSGPAYFFYLVELLEKIALAKGFNVEESRLMAAQTFLGSAAAFAKSTLSAEGLRTAVTSKGGTTEAAFKQFDSDDLGVALEKGIQAAIKKAGELNS